MKNIIKATAAATLLTGCTATELRNNATPLSEEQEQRVLNAIEYIGPRVDALSTTHLAPRIDTVFLADGRIDTSSDRSDFGEEIASVGKKLVELFEGGKVLYHPIDQTDRTPGGGALGTHTKKSDKDDLIILTDAAFDPANSFDEDGLLYEVLQHESGHLFSGAIHSPAVKKLASAGADDFQLIAAYEHHDYTYQLSSVTTISRGLLFYEDHPEFLLPELDGTYNVYIQRSEERPKRGTLPAVDNEEVDPDRVREFLQQLRESTFTDIVDDAFSKPEMAEYYASVDHYMGISVDDIIEILDERNVTESELRRLIEQSLQWLDVYYPENNEARRELRRLPR